MVLKEGWAVLVSWAMLLRDATVAGPEDFPPSAYADRGESGTSGQGVPHSEVAKTMNSRAVTSHAKTGCAP